MKCLTEVCQAWPRPNSGLPDIVCPLHDKTSWSRVLAASVWARNKSISARSSPLKLSAPKKFTTTSGCGITLSVECPGGTRIDTLRLTDVDDANLSAGEPGGGTAWFWPNCSLATSLTEMLPDHGAEGLEGR